MHNWYERDSLAAQPQEHITNTQSTVMKIDRLVKWQNHLVTFLPIQNAKRKKETRFLSLITYKWHGYTTHWITEYVCMYMPIILCCDFITTTLINGCEITSTRLHTNVYNASWCCHYTLHITTICVWAAEERQREGERGAGGWVQGQGSVAATGDSICASLSGI